MIKKFLIIFFILVLNLLLMVKITKGQGLDATSESKIEEFKEKIASKVAQLNKEKFNKAISGLIKEIKKDSFILMRVGEEKFTVMIDEVITKIYQIKGNQVSEYKFSDLTINDFVIISGIMDGLTINANSIYKEEQFLVLKGKIIEVNKQEYALKILTDEKKNYILDIETYTNQNMLNIKTLEIEKIGFSKIKEGDTIHFVIKKDKEGKLNRFSARKILIIPQEYFLIPSENK